MNRTNRSNLRDEGGYTIIAVLMIMLIGLAIVTVAVGAVITATNSSSRDSRVRRAQQAAQAGIQAQLYDATQSDLGSASYNLNGGPLGLSTTLLDCVVPTINVGLQITGITDVAANTAGVCPQAESCTSVTTCTTSTNLNEPVGDNTTYQSEMVTGQVNQSGSAQDELFPKIVSIGTEKSSSSDSVPIHSREEAILAPVSPLQAVEGEGTGSNSVTLTGVGTTTVSVLGLINITTTTNAAAVLNGNITSKGTVNLPFALVGLNLSLANGSLLSAITAKNTTGGAISTATTDTNSSAVSQVPSRTPVIVSDSKPECGTGAGVSETCSSLITCTITADCSTANNAFSLTGGTATFAPGDYVFCGFNAAAGSVLQTTGSGVVRIFIRNPSTTNDCSTDSSSPYYGEFNDPVGFNNSVVGTLNGLNPSALQIYNAGSGAVNIGGSTTATCSGTSVLDLVKLCLSVTVPIQSMIVYAPSSSVNVNTTGCVANLAVLGIPVASACAAGVFEGSIVGNTSSVTATAVTQDLDLGNFPLYAGVNAFRVEQYIQCDNSVTSLTGAVSDENGC
jgi:type II secretory pathway pseudopilin PulG